MSKKIVILTNLIKKILNRGNRNGMLMLVLIPVFCTLAGCGSESRNELIKLERSQYQKNEYKTAIAAKGDMNPVLNLTLKPMEVDEIRYSVNETDLEVEDINVEVGDNVKAGQVLISFKSDEIKKNIDKYSSEVTKSELLLSHYERTYNIDRKDRDDKYGVILQELKDSVAIAKLYLEEEQERLQACQVIAERDGIVTFISKSVLSGVVDPEAVLLIENCGRNSFYAETDDSFEFRIGDVYQAEYNEDYCSMTVVDVQEGPGVMHTIIFEPEYALINVSSATGLKMGVDKGNLSGIVYVDSRAICRKNNDYFVYKVVGDGYLEAQYVTLGDEVDNVTIITSGLEGGEEVALY